MKQIIPFEKDILFKTKIGELTSISLDNDLILKGEDLIIGNFYIKGTYKMLSSSTSEEEYSYKIPCEIQISDEYDTYDCNIDIDDFTYEIKNDDTLYVKISVSIDNLVKKETLKDITEQLETREELPTENSTPLVERIVPETPKEIKTTEEPKEEINEQQEQQRDIPEVVDERENISPINVINDIKSDIIKETEERYLTYKVYIVTEEDTIETITEKYSVTKEQIKDYNEFDNLQAGMKLVIPSTINDWL